jgi:hypothetical protein
MSDLIIDRIKEAKWAKQKKIKCITCGREIEKSLYQNSICSNCNDVLSKEAKGEKIRELAKETQKAREESLNE